MIYLIFKKICILILFVVSIILSWGGIIYAANHPDGFQWIGIIVSFVGYLLFLWTVLLYEEVSDESF